MLTREFFHADWDDTTIDEKARYVQIRKPDGVPDVIQQVEHGALQILAQYKAVGHALNGIIEPTLEEYTHLGDAASQTDGKVYSDKMGLLESDGTYSGVPDDRWAFTTRSTPLEYDAASRVLRGYNDQLADECLKTATRVWDDEHSHAPNIFHSFNITGGDLQSEEVKAAVELLITTKGGEAYRKRLTELWPAIQQRFMFLNWTAVRAIPYMDSQYKTQLEQEVRAYTRFLTGCAIRQVRVFARGPTPQGTDSCRPSSADSCSTECPVRLTPPSFLPGLWLQDALAARPRVRSGR